MPRTSHKAHDQTKIYVLIQDGSHDGPKFFEAISDERARAVWEREVYAAGPKAKPLMLFRQVSGK